MMWWLDFAAGGMGDAWLILVIGSCLHVLMVVWLWLTIDRWLLMMLVIWGKTPTKIRWNSPRSPRLSARFWMPKPILQYTPCSWEGRCMGSGASSNNLYLISLHNPWTIFVFSCACSTMTFCPKHLAEHDPFLALPNFPTPPTTPPKKALCLVGLPLYLPCSASRFRFGIGMWRHSGEAYWDGLGLERVGWTRMISAGAMIAMKIPIWDVLRRCFFDEHFQSCKSMTGSFCRRIWSFFCVSAMRAGHTACSFVGHLWTATKFLKYTAGWV